MNEWDKLNNRQKEYLRCIYKQDQIQERAHQQSSTMYHYDNTPASVWRTIEYADTYTGYTPLKHALVDAQLVDPGTGSTFKALATRGFIEVHGDWTSAVYIRLTTRGRKLARDVMGIRAPKSLPTGSLREWHWRALAKTYEAGAQGVPEQGMGYGRIGWNTWLRLRDYKIGGVEYPLAEERLGMSITPFGRAYYERSFVRYHELYPAIDAPTPEIEVDPLEPFVEVIQDHSACQACRSAYPVAVTRTYRQNQKWIWSVELSSQRIEGRVTDKYREIEQCLCQEGEVQEVFAPFLALLDRFIAQKWQMCFLYYRRWFYDLDYLVGGMANGRERRWYASALVKTKVLPLLSDTDIDDDHNVAKGEMRFCVNERRGVGSIYSLTAPDDLRPQPLAMARRVTL